MRSIIRFVTALVLSIAAGAAAAGVIIVDVPGNHHVFGQFAAPTAPPTLNAYLYCELLEATVYGGGGDAETVTDKHCTSTDPAVKSVLPMIGRSSTLQIYWDDSGTCTQVLVYNNTANLQA